MVNQETSAPGGRRPAAGAARPLHQFASGDCDTVIFQSWREIDPAVWKSLFSSQCKDCRYYETAEETLGGQFQHRYFVFRNQKNETVVQPFFAVSQDLTTGLPGRLRSPINWIRKRWPGFLKLRMLMVGCTAAEGQLGSRAPWAVQALQRALKETARREKASILVFKDFPAEYREALSGLTKNGFSRVPSMPGARLEIDCKDFEEFMQVKLGKVYRKNLRRKFKSSAELGALTMEVLPDVTPFADEIQSLYLQTHDRSKLKFEQLTGDYFRMLGQRMPDRTRYFLWRLEGRLVGFALCLVHGDTLHDLNLGVDYRVALNLHLYFVTFRDVINWAAANGLKHYVTGPLNYDPKLHLQLELDPLDIYARHRNPVLNVFFKLAIKYLEPVRYDAVIRKFRNFHELY